MVPAKACAIQEIMQPFEMDLADPSYYQSPATDAAKTAYDAAAYYEQLAFMLETQNLAFQMTQALPFAMPETEVPQAPPGLDSIVPPPGLEPDSFGGSSRQGKKDTQKMNRQICWFQNRYHHAKPGDNISPCSAGDDCQFCHGFHPKLARRDKAKSLCSCSAHYTKQNPAASDSASTRLDDECSLETSSSDEFSNVPSYKGLQVIPLVPTPEEVPLPQTNRMKNQNKIINLAADDIQTNSTDSPPVMRQICYFQNRWHNRQEGDEEFAPCSKGDDCLHCHEIHPKIKRRNDKTSRCLCPLKH